jgi:hypothetical protein
MMDAGVGVALVAVAGYVAGRLTPRRGRPRHTYCVVRQHGKPDGYEVVYESRSPGSCKRFRDRAGGNGARLFVATRSAVDAHNAATVATTAFWGDVRALSAGTPSAVASHVRDLCNAVNHVGAIGGRLLRTLDTEALTMVNGIPLSPTSAIDVPGARHRGGRP